MRSPKTGHHFSMKTLELLVTEGELDMGRPEEGELDIDGPMLAEGPCREQKYYESKSSM